MIGPPSQVSKLLLVLFLFFTLFFLYMDYLLYLRIQNYPIDRGIHADNVSMKYEEVAWVSCDINPLCDITVKGMLMDAMNLYLLAPLSTILENTLQISHIKYITPSAISFFHVFVAVLSGKCVSSDNLMQRRLGVVLFEIRTFLDDLDGHVARVYKHIRGEMSEIGTMGYYVDGVCDALGCVALLVGIFVFLKNNPPRRGYCQLPSSESTKDISVIYNTKVHTTRKVIKKLFCFIAQLIISSTAWNRYIALYQDLLGRNDVSLVVFEYQNVVFRSTVFFIVSWLWKVINFHNMLHWLLLAIFCDKLWEFLCNIQYIGYGVLLSAICVTEMHIMSVKNFIFHRPN